jgi:hypothetical protein
MGVEGSVELLQWCYGLITLEEKEANKDLVNGVSLILP